MKNMLWIWIGCSLLAAAVSFAADGDPGSAQRTRIYRQMVYSARVEQQRLEESGLLYRDDALEQYLHGIAVRLIDGADGSAEDVRIQVVRNPYLDAYTLPGGFCFVSTGMLARIENEAQLTAMLAHEIAHILHHHARNGIRYLHNETRTEGEHSNSTGYRLEAEIEADRDSLQMLVQAGYDPLEIIRLYEHLQEELSLEKAEEHRFSRTHPPLRRRIELFRQMIARLPVAEHRNLNQGERFQQHVLPVMLDNAEMDIGVGRFLQARRTLARYLAANPGDSKAHFLMGEVHRQQGRSEEVSLAKTWYRRAIALDAGYAAPHRALGLICYKSGETAAASHHLKTSLALAPESMDNAYIRHYLNRLRKE